MTTGETDGKAQPREVWASGEAYELFMGRWSRLVAARFVEWLAAAPGSAWLDVGCGTGALTRTILQAAAPGAVTGIDLSEQYIALARSLISDSRVQFRTADAQALPVETAAYDAVVSSLLLQFVPEPPRVAAEMARAARRGGTVAAYVWDYGGRMQFLRHFWNAATTLDPAAADLDQGRRFPLCNPGPLYDLFSEAGLADVEVASIDVWTVFENFEDYWEPFLGQQGPAATYVAGLTNEQRMMLRERIRAGLPFALDGSIPLMARAWAVRGVRA